MDRPRRAALFVALAGLLALANGLQAGSASPTLTADPVAVSWGNGRVDVFARASDNSLWYQWSENGAVWSEPESLGGELIGGPGASTWGQGRIDVFARGGNNGLWQLTYAGVWGRWAKVGDDDTMTSEPAAVSWGQGRIDVFAKGNPDGLWHMWFDGVAWRGPENLGGELVGRPVAITNGPNTLTVIVRGAANNLFAKSYDNGWRDWVRLAPDNVASAPAAANASIAGYGPMAFFKDQSNVPTLVFWSNWGLTSGWTTRPLGAADNISGSSIVREADNSFTLYGRGSGDNKLYRRPIIADGSSDWQAVSAGQTYITDIKVITGNSVCGAGWEKNPQDLNEGSGGEYVYLCTKRGPKDQALTSLNVLDRREENVTYDRSYPWGRCRSTAMTMDPVNLNEGTGGHHMYFCFGRSETATRIIREIDFNVWTHTPAAGVEFPCTGSKWSGWTNASLDPASTDFAESNSVTDTDVNAGAKGKFIFPCLRLDPK